MLPINIEYVYHQVYKLNFSNIARLPDLTSKSTAASIANIFFPILSNVSLNNT